ncbi:DUF2721 domain-containing protein [Archangium lipolyticum]|uniref:DUF2721 domain-containing protein n=1 Tax=Archangium lipolyticum TaxID=2970465 RepID=UPI00214A89EA|nr:DUF2721 domain-containing protein [Archangium lipolyticum]
MDATVGVDISSIRVIGAAVTPAVMVSACGILASGLDNQIARMTSRLREMLKEWRSLPEEDPRREVLKAEVAILDRRHLLLARAMGMAYGALISFVLTSLLYLSQRRFGVPDVLPVVSFSVGVVLLGVIAVFALASLRLGRDAIALEKREMFRDAETPSPPGERSR